MSNANPKEFLDALRQYLTPRAEADPDAAAALAGVAGLENVLDAVGILHALPAGADPVMRAQLRTERLLSALGARMDSALLDDIAFRAAPALACVTFDTTTKAGRRFADELTEWMAHTQVQATHVGRTLDGRCGFYFFMGEEHVRRVREKVEAMVTRHEATQRSRRFSIRDRSAPEETPSPASPGPAEGA